MHIGASEALPWNFSMSSAEEWIVASAVRAEAAPLPVESSVDALASSGSSCSRLASVVAVDWL